MTKDNSKIRTNDVSFEAMAASGFLYSKTEFTKLINYLGALWKHVIAYSNATTDNDYIYGADADSFMNIMQSLRSECATATVNDLTTDAVNQPSHYDNANVLTNSIRNIEKGLPASLKNLISPIIVSYNSFIMNQKGVTAKVWFDTGGDGNTDKFSASDWVTLFTPCVLTTVSVTGIASNGTITTSGNHNLTAGTPVKIDITSGNIVANTTYYVKTDTVAASSTLSLVTASDGSGSALTAAAAEADAAKAFVLTVQTPQTRFGNEFIQLWRYATNQELRVPICKFTYNGATWDKVVTNHAGTLSTACLLQARWTRKSTTTTSLQITGFTPTGATEVTISPVPTAMTAAYVPAGTATGYTNLGNTSYTSIDSISVTAVASTEEGTAPDDDPDTGDVITIYSM